MKQRLLSVPLALFSLAAVAQTCPPTDLILTTQNEIDAFSADYPGCTAIPVNLTISGTEIISLAGLSQITTIDGDLVITSNTALTGLSGLNNLTAVTGRLEISSNPQLTSLAPLGNLNSIGGELRLTSNPQVPSLYGLENINYQTITHLVVESSVTLSYCGVASICSYLAEPLNTFSISGNATGCNTLAEIDGACGGPLPVGLIGFSAQPDNGRTVLRWKTASETNNAGFDIQRSFNMSVWETIGFVPGKGTTFELTSYAYSDENPLVGVNYYRLRQLNFDGTAAFSPVVSALIQPGREISLYPNPTTGKVLLTGNHPENITLSDYQGRELKQTFGTEIDLSDLPAGMYIVRLMGGNMPACYPVLKE
jgi:hypothetical protein